MQTTVTESDSERMELERLAFEAEQAAQIERHRRFFAERYKPMPSTHIFVARRSFIVLEPEFAI